MSRAKWDNSQNSTQKMRALDDIEKYVGFAVRKKGDSDESRENPTFASESIAAYVT